MGAFNFVSSMREIFFLRGIHGIIFALATTVVSTLAVIVLPKHRKGEGINMFAVFSNIAMVLGPAIGLLALDQYGTNTLFMVVTGMTFFAMIVANLKTLPLRLALPQRKKQQCWELSTFIEHRSLPWALMGLFVGFCYSGVLVFVPIELNSQGIGTWASLFFGLYACMSIVSRPMGSKIYERKGPEYVVYPGLILFAIGIAILGLTSNPYGIVVAAPIIGLGYGMAQPAFQALAVESAPIERAGVATATYFLSLDISVGIGSAVLAVAAHVLGFQDTYKIIAGIVIVALALYHFFLLNIHIRNK